MPFDRERKTMMKTVRPRVPILALLHQVRLMAALVVLLPPSKVFPASAHAKPPNVLLLFADDQRHAFHFPPVDKLPAHEGMPDPFVKPDGTRVTSREEWP